MTDDTLAVRAVLIGHDEHDAHARRYALEALGEKMLGQMERGKYYCLKVDERVRPMLGYDGIGPFGQNSELVIAVEVRAVEERPIRAMAVYQPEYDKMPMRILCATALGEINHRIKNKLYWANRAWIKWRVKMAWINGVANLRKLFGKNP